MTIVYPCGCIAQDPAPKQPYHGKTRYSHVDKFCKWYGTKQTKDIPTDKVDGTKQTLRRFVCERLNQEGIEPMPKQP